MTKTAFAFPNLDILSAQSAVASSAGRENWMVLVPKGRILGRDGRGPYEAGGTTAAMQAIVDRTKARAGKTELMVDYDHQSVFAAIPGVGGQARAAGWIKEYRITDAGIEGCVQWTDAAAQAIRAQEYRYLSPVFKHDTNGRILALHSVGLVNAPNFDLEAVAASVSLQRSGPPMFEKIAKALGLAETATEDEIVAAIEKLSVSANSADPAAFVPIGVFQQTLGELHKLKQGVSAHAANEAVSLEIARGTLLPFMKDWAVNLCQSNKPAFDQFIEKGGSMVALPHGRGAAPTSELLSVHSAHQKRQSDRGGSRELDPIASKLGLTAEDVKTYGRS